MTSTLNEVDTSERSLIYNSLMPACYELSYQSLMLDEFNKKIFAKSALENGYYDDLKQRCIEQGIEQKEATTATGVIKVTGTKNSKFPNGALVSTILGLTYTTQSEVILDDTGIAYVNITASGEGSKYNAEIGEINSLPVKYEGILSIVNEEKIDNGYDLETPEELYNRYLLKVQTPATSGNKYHYMNWALEVDGVGIAKVYPLANGPGTVKVVVANSNKRAASEELIQEVYNHIEENRPIGAGVSATTVTEKTINFTANVQISTTVTLNDVQNNFAKAIGDYFKEITFNINKISIAKIGSLLLSINGVLDYSDLKMNNLDLNIILNDDEIGILGTVTLGVM